ncbi:TPA: hypothetical protein PIZ10_005199, partial [Escherichia coli]|nr:hypothetical protein [Escherichia coli]
MSLNKPGQQVNRSVWEGEQLAGMGALKLLDDKHGELKSMRTAPNYLRRGV